MFVVGLILAVSATISTADEANRGDDAKREYDIAGRYAPIFYQALGDKPHSDYITNFDFDGDWRGDNNWDHADDPQFTLKAFIYYSVVETTTHIFIHYAVFHPRDYKGGEERGTLLSELLREGMKHGAKYDPTGLGQEAILAHENDMEGCLVIVARNGKDSAKGRVEFVETLHHNTFIRYTGNELAGYTTIKVEDNHPLLYVEPKGHGIESLICDAKQCGRKDFLRYRFDTVAGRSEGARVCTDLESTPCRDAVSYDLLPLASTLWTRAQDAPNITYGEAHDYEPLQLSYTDGKEVVARKVEIGKIGSAFLGSVGGQNMARPPWGWFDLNRRDRSLGSWFFDPASTIKEDFGLDKSFSTVYSRLPFWALKRTDTTSEKEKKHP